MPRVAPFRGLHYSLDRFGASGERVAVLEDAATPPPRLADITDVACPPYDVISAEDRAELLARDEHNAVRLEYSPEPDPHAAAAETLAAWLADGTLVRRDEPAAYYYRHATSANRDELTVEGIVVRVLVEPWGDAIRPHEHTMPGPKQDRLGLLRATGTQLSPILAVYFDRSERYNRIVLSTPRRFRESVGRYAAFLAACKAHDGATAERTVQESLTWAVERVAGDLPSEADEA